MSNNFSQFKQQIDQALSLVESASVIKEQQLPQLNSDQLVDTQSLLKRCEQVCDKHQKEKPTIRIIHHLACSGGTLVSKCISAMPNVYLLSEVHPYTDLAMGADKPKYAPSDIVSLTKYAGVPKQKELAAKLFKNAIDEVYQHVTKLGGILVLRDHTHADFNTEQSIPQKSSIIELLEEDYNVQSVLTTRNPIDSYASLVKNGWVHFEPQTFDEYCRRLLLLLDKFEGARIFKYEDFVDDPQQQMQYLAKALELPFDSSFEDVFGMFRVTGDSGRSSDVIETRDGHIPEWLSKEASLSKEFLSILK